MKKDATRSVAALLIVLVLYHLIVFLIPFYQDTNFWIAYVFSLVAFVIAGYAIYVSSFKDESAKSRFYGFPILRIAMFYGVVQLIAGVVIMALDEYLPYELVIIVEAVGLGAVLLGLIATTSVNDTIQEMDTKLKKDVALMRSLQSKLTQIAGFCEDPEACAAVKGLAEEFRYSDPVSNPAIARAEADLVAAVDALQQAVTDGDAAAVKTLCRSASVALAERNRLCLINK